MQPGWRSTGSRHRTGYGSRLPRQLGPRPCTAATGARRPLMTAHTPEHAIADPDTVCAVLAGHGTEMRRGDMPNTGGGAGDGARAPEFVAPAGAAGMEAPDRAASPRRLATARLEGDG